MIFMDLCTREGALGAGGTGRFITGECCLDSFNVCTTGTGVVSFFSSLAGLLITAYIAPHSASS